jgi:fumarate reductase subunit C
MPWRQPEWLMTVNTAAARLGNLRSSGIREASMDPSSGGVEGARPARHGRSAWPARMDVVQGATGLALGLFMWGHMFFVSSILVSKDAMWSVAKLFEGYFFFGRSYPILVSGVVAAIFALIGVHAFLAMRKFPASYRQYR